MRNQPPYNSSQKHFITILKLETLKNPQKKDCLTYKNTGNVIDSVVDIKPYNSVGNQSFRTLFSAKVGSSRFMIPTNSNFEALPITVDTILKGMASIFNHPYRQFEHRRYYINFDEKVENESKLTVKLPKLQAPNVVDAVKNFDLAGIKLPLD